MKDKMAKQSGMSNKDYQPGEKEFAGSMMGKANMYMERTDKRMTKDAGRVKSQAFDENRYD